MPVRRNPFTEAGREGLLKRMERDKCRTFSDKVRWVETHMPSIDDPASFVGALVRGETKNPVDPDYTQQLGEGAFAKAFGKPDPLAPFYRGLDRGPRAVETKAQRESDRYPWMKGAANTVDVAKIVLVLARQALKGNKEAQAYLPDIKPVRIDYTNPKAPELIYAMPYYQTLEEPDTKLTPQNKQLYQALAAAGGVEATIEECIDDLRLYQARKHPSILTQIFLVSGVLQAIEEAAKHLPFEVKNLSMDIHEGNVAVDAHGHLILLDPIVAVADLEGIERFWQQADWPGGPESGKKLPRKAKR